MTLSTKRKNELRKGYRQIRIHSYRVSVNKHGKQTNNEFVQWNDKY